MRKHIFPLKYTHTLSITNKNVDSKSKLRVGQFLAVETFNHCPADPGITVE